jgi:putative ABC transport system substrate-binding protein
MKQTNKIIFWSLFLGTAIAIFFFFIVNTISFEKKNFVIGIVNPNTGLRKITEGFISGMAEYGYIEGENVTYIKSYNPDEMDSALKYMVDKKVDLIFTVTTPATKKAQKATRGTNIPVVFGAVFDPVESGLVKSLHHPGGNITGIQVRGSTQKALEWLLAIVPDIKHIFVPVAFDTKAAYQSLADLKQGARKLDIKLTISEVYTLEELQGSLSHLPDDVDAIFILNSIFIVSNIRTIVDKAIELELPIGSGTGQYKNGVTITYGQKHFYSGRKASRLAHKILQGIAASDLPVEITDFFLGINLRTAEASNIEIPDDILQLADFIVR